MTVFAKNDKENLHGHNYRTELQVDLQDCDFDQMIAFSIFKDQMREICKSWDEKILLPALCPYLKIAKKTSREIDFKLCGKRYVLPMDEVVLLPVDNVITETLAMVFCQTMIAKLGSKIRTPNIKRIELKIEEMTGQGASYIWLPPTQ